MTVLTSRDLPGEYLTVAEVAAKLRCPEPIVRRRIRDGEIPAVQLGGRGSAVRVARVGLEAWLWSRPIRGSTRRTASATRTLTGTTS